MESKHNEEKVYPRVRSGLLEIDSQGRIWRNAQKGRRRAEHDIGKYYQVRAMIQGVRHYALAHRLVWLHFRGPIPGQLTVNHLNGNPKDNRPENLELCSLGDNTRHACQVLNRKRDQWGKKNSMAKLSDTDIDEIRRRRKSGETLEAIAADYPVRMQQISRICRGDRWNRSRSQTG